MTFADVAIVLFAFPALISAFLIQMAFLVAAIREVSA